MQNWATFCTHIHHKVAIGNSAVFIMAEADVVGVQPLLGVNWGCTLHKIDFICHFFLTQFLHYELIYQLLLKQLSTQPLLCFFGRD